MTDLATHPASDRTGPWAARWVVSLLLLGLPTVGLAQAGSEAFSDPFYVSLLREGTQTLIEGNPRRAAETLRIACFGLLEDPPLLGRCLSHLLIAQGESGDREGLADTFRRLNLVEERFGGFRNAQLDPGLRARLEGWLVRMIPEEQLSAVSAFAPLANRRIVAKLRRSPPRDQRQELEAWIAKRPDEPQFRLALAELELFEGRPDEAVRLANETLAQDPSLPEARCLRGLGTYRRDKQCAAVAEDLLACPWSREDLRYAEPALACALETGRLAAARLLLGELASGLSESREISKLARQVEAARREAAASGGRPGVDAPTPTPAPEAQPSAASPATSDRRPLSDPGTSRSTPQAPTSAAPPGPGRGSERPATATAQATPNPAVPPPAQPAPAPSGPSETDLRRLQQARARLADVRQAGELEEPLRTAREIADRHPEYPPAQFLAGEIAYRASRWQEAALYFRRGGDPGDGDAELLFYMAVAFWEAGDRARAASTLRRALPRLEQTAFVEQYRRRILGEEPSR